MTTAWASARRRTGSRSRGTATSEQTPSLPPPQPQETASRPRLQAQTTSTAPTGHAAATQDHGSQLGSRDPQGHQELPRVLWNVPEAQPTSCEGKSQCESPAAVRREDTATARLLLAKPHRELLPLSRKPSPMSCLVAGLHRDLPRTPEHKDLGVRRAPGARVPEPGLGNDPAGPEIPWPVAPPSGGREGSRQRSWATQTGQPSAHPLLLRRLLSPAGRSPARVGPPALPPPARSQSSLCSGHGVPRVELPFQELRSLWWNVDTFFSRLETLLAPCPLRIYS